MSRKLYLIMLNGVIDGEYDWATIEKIGTTKKQYVFDAYGEKFLFKYQ